MTVHLSGGKLMTLSVGTSPFGRDGAAFNLACPATFCTGTTGRAARAGKGGGHAGEAPVAGAHQENRVSSTAC